MRNFRFFQKYFDYFFFKIKSIDINFVNKIINYFFIKVLGQGLLFILMVILARMMGVESYGIYVYVLAWLNISVLLGKFGTDIALLRYVSIYFSNNDWRTLNGILRWGNKIVLLGCFIIIVGGVLIIEIIGDGITTELEYTFLISWAVLPLLALASLRQAALRAIGHILLSQIPELILRPAILIVIVLIVVNINFELNAFSVMSLYFVSIFLSFYIGSYWLKRSLPEKINENKPVSHGYEWFKVSFPMLIVSGSFMTLNQTDTIMIGILLDKSSAGIYNASSKIASLIQFGFLAILSITMPMIASMYANEKYAELQKLLTVSALGASLFALPCLIFLIIWGEHVLQLFGDGFSIGYISLIILAIGQLLNAFTGSTGAIMTMTGHQRVAAYVIAASAILNIPVNWALISVFGMEGAALSTLLSSMVWNFSLAGYACKHMKLNPTALFFLKCGK